MIHFTRIPVFISSIIVVFTFLILSLPHRFPILLILSTVISICVFFVLARKKQYVAAILFAALILVSSVNTFCRYTGEELYAEKFIDTVSQNPESEYTAVISNVRNYGAYSIIFADIVSFDGNVLKTPVRSRLGCYSAGELLNGDTLVFTGTPKKLDEIENDGFNTKNYLRSKNVFCEFENISVISSSASAKQSLISSFRKHMEKSIYTYIPDSFSKEASSVCYAMFSGDKDTVSKETADVFKKSGLTHILCVSGMHLSILTGALFSFLTMLTVKKQHKCVCVIILCCLYTVLTGLSMSTLRACIICITTYSAMLMGRKTDAYISLFFAILTICLIFPYSVFDISLQLSFLSTLGIICFSDIASHRNAKGFFEKVGFYALDLLLSNVGAVIFTLPVSAAYFGEFSSVSVFSTFCVSYICEVLLSLLLLFFILSAFLPLGFTGMLMSIIGEICAFCSSATIKTAEFFAGLRYASVSETVSEFFIFTFILILTILCISIGFGHRKTFFISVMSLILAVTFFTSNAIISAITNDGTYKVMYFRKNENDRQLSVNLCGKGFLLINADNRLCTDYNKCNFDTVGKNNYLLIIPDEILVPSLLAESINDFDKRFGIEMIFVPHTSEGTLISSALFTFGIECAYMPALTDFGSATLKFDAKKPFTVLLDDGKTKTEIVYSDSYSNNLFGEDNDICAYFTRKTKNQFDPTSDISPNCDVFFTRMGKNDTKEGIVNTFSETCFYIKE